MEPFFLSCLQWLTLCIARSPCWPYPKTSSSVSLLLVTKYHSFLAPGSVLDLSSVIPLPFPTLTEYSGFHFQSCPIFQWPFPTSPHYSPTWTISMPPNQFLEYGFPQIHSPSCFHTYFLKALLLFFVQVWTEPSLDAMYCIRSGDGKINKTWSFPLWKL